MPIRDDQEFFHDDTLSGIACPVLLGAFLMLRRVGLDIVLIYDGFLCCFWRLENFPRGAVMMHKYR